MNPTITEVADPDELERLRGGLAHAAAELVPSSAAPAVVLESPRNAAFGDFASNVALQLARAAKRAPQQLALDIVERAFARDPSLHELVAETNVAAGFINVRLSAAYWQRALAAVIRAGRDYGAGAATGERVSLEFGSANPTGPVVVVQGRTLSLGDSLARVMRFIGIDVTTEWIVNDAGSQIDTLGRSLYARYRQFGDPAYPFPADGYPGDYLLPIARALRDREGARYDASAEAEWLPAFARDARDAIVAGQQATCRRFGVEYDNWQSERELHASGAVEAGIVALRERGLIFEADGALWVRATEFGDDKDRVIVRGDGRPTYFGGDVAYHHAKLSRAGRAILILGPDHHGYIARLHTIAAALGRPGAIEVVLTQQMTTVRDGEIVSSSKRHGDILMLDDVLDEVGVDATRFFFVLLNADSPMTFDLTLAKKQTLDNPVFYVQYGHARIASILAKARAEVIAGATRGESLERLVAPAELALARRLCEFPTVLRAVAEKRAPIKLAHYAQTIASDFTQFYVDCRVLSDDAALSTARLALSMATKSVLAKSLELLGVSAPEAM